MRNQIAIGLLRVVSVVLLCGATEVQGTRPVAPPYPKTNLVSFLAQWKPTPAALGLVCELRPQWVGTVRRAYLRNGEDIYKEDQPNPLRFSHLLVSRDLNGRTNLTVLRGRLTAQGKLGSFRAVEAPVFRSNLPSVKAVSAAKSLEELRKLFGPQHGITDGWGEGGRLHWTEGWTWFTTEGKGRLRYLSVFAHVSSRDRAKGADIDILHVTEGFFHPANPNSAAERRQYQTGEEVQAEEEERRAQARAAYPLPLRSLMEARETPDDSDLVAYKRALNDVRRHPSPELFRQLAEYLDEGTCEVQRLLEHILFDDFLKLDKWEAPRWNVALRALTDALPQVKSNLALDQLVVVLLQAQGGGALKVAVPGSTGVVEVKAQRAPDGSRSSFTTSSRNISSENLARAARKCQQALKERYPELR